MVPQTEALVATAANTLIARLDRGEVIPLSTILEALKPTAPPPDKVTPAAPPAVMTDQEKAALKLLPSVFGAVCPESARLLTQDEIDALVEERATLDAVEKMATRRKTDIRTIVFAHLDTEVSVPEGGEAPARDERGNYLVKGEIVSHKLGARLTREIRGGAVSISESKLRALADDPEVEWFTHKDYLAMTRPAGRVVDEVGVADFMRRKPETAVRALAAASERAPDSPSCYQRSLHLHR